MATLVARGLTKRFQTTCAVDGVDLVLGEGEVRGLLGPNGAGKDHAAADAARAGAAGSRHDRVLGRGPTQSDSLVLDGVSGLVEDPSF